MKSKDNYFDDHFYKYCNVSLHSYILHIFKAQLSPGKQLVNDFNVNVSVRSVINLLIWTGIKQNNISFSVASFKIFLFRNKALNFLSLNAQQPHLLTGFEFNSGSRGSPIFQCAQLIKHTRHGCASQCGQFKDDSENHVTFTITDS